MMVRIFATAALMALFMSPLAITAQNSAEEAALLQRLIEQEAAQSGQPPLSQEEVMAELRALIIELNTHGHQTERERAMEEEAARRLLEAEAEAQRRYGR